MQIISPLPMARTNNKFSYSIMNIATGTQRVFMRECSTIPGSFCASFGARLSNGGRRYRRDTERSVS